MNRRKHVWLIPGKEYIEFIKTDDGYTLNCKVLDTNCRAVRVYSGKATSTDSFFKYYGNLLTYVMGGELVMIETLDGFVRLENIRHIQFLTT